jgi:hypothetical protein
LIIATTGVDDDWRGNASAREGGSALRLPLVLEPNCDRLYFPE